MPYGLSFVPGRDLDSNGGVADTMAFSLFMVGQTESFVPVHRRARPFDPARSYPPHGSRDWS